MAESILIAGGVAGYVNLVAARNHAWSLIRRGYRVWLGPIPADELGSVEIFYEPSAIFPPTDPSLMLLACESLARRVAIFNVELAAVETAVSPYINEVNAEAVKTHDVGYMLACNKVICELADLICALGEFERLTLPAMYILQKNVRCN
jgi:hypothetical protein